MIDQTNSRSSEANAPEKLDVCEVNAPEKSPMSEATESTEATPVEQPAFCFVVLHYKTLDETLKCLDSLEHTVTYPNRHVVVVDNGSGDGSGEDLERRYASNHMVSVLRNEENLGFAQGNNVGFRYAKHKLACSYICLLNSDVVITQPDVCERVMGIMGNNGAALVGPQIVNPDGSKLGPHTPPGLAFLECDTKDMEVSLRVAERGIDGSKHIFARRLLHTLFVRGYRSQRPRPLDPDRAHDNAIIEGCCLFFSPDYVERFEGLDDRTFLYHEEDFLHLRLLKADMSSRYDPQISIFHNHHATTRAVAGDALEHKLFRLRHQLESRKLLLEELRKAD